MALVVPTAVEATEQAPQGEKAAWLAKVAWVRQAAKVPLEDKAAALERAALEHASCLKRRAWDLTAASTF